METLFDLENEPEVKKFDDWVKEDFIQYDYRIVIPTYKRYEILKNKTLKTLISGGISADKIDIFVADDVEKKLYEKTLTPGTYSRIVVAKKGVAAVRNFIQDFYLENQLLINFDDDVEKIQKFVDEKNLIDFKDLNDFFCYAFFVAKKYNVNVWGGVPSR